MPEGQFLSAADELHIVAGRALASGEVVQTNAGRAAVVAGTGVAYAAGDKVRVIDQGVVRFAKTASMAILPGGRVYWDRSANKATVVPTAGQNDFYLGVATADAAASGTTVDVKLNEQPGGIDLWAPGVEWNSTAVLGLGTVQTGNSYVLAFDATAEAAKADLYSTDTIPAAQTPIFEALVRIDDNGDTGVLDMNFGIATGTHATDFDSVAEFVTVQVEGNALNVNVTSDDGTTDTTITDSTIDYVAGTAFHIAIDARVTSACVVYINGVAAGGGADLALDGGSGPWLPIAHIEKESNDTTADVHVLNMNLRPGDLV